MSIVFSPPISYTMQDFRPRLSSTYQPRQSLSHLVSKFENLDSRPQRANYAPMPRRTKTLPTVPPGQWLSSTENNLSEKQPPEEQPETPSASTFGHRHKSVAERRKLFEDTDAFPNGRTSGTRVFSRDVSHGPSLPTTEQASLQGAIETTERVDDGRYTEAIRQVRRMPRLEVARNRPPPSDEPEWPLKSDSPLRTSFESYHAKRTSVEWKPSPARERSLSRRRKEFKPVPVDTARFDASSTRSSSNEARTLGSTVGHVSSSKEKEEEEEVSSAVTAVSSHKPQPRDWLDEPASSNDLAGQTFGPASRLSTQLPKTEKGAGSIGYPSTQPQSTSSNAALPASQTHGVLFLSRNSGSWATKQGSSPLKDKIGIFESLSRQSSTADSTRSLRGSSEKPPHPPQPRRNTSKQAAYLSRTASRIKATLRKIPVSWERGHSKRELPLGKENADGGNNHQGAENKSEEKSCTNDSMPLPTGKREPASRVNIRRLFSPVSSLSGKGAWPTPTPYNFISRGGGPKTSSANPKPASKGLLSVFGSDNTTSTQSAPAAATPAPNSETRTIGAQPSRGKRWISRSGDEPMIARAQCKLDQPMPVRGDELKRLVTLCKDSALRRRSRGQTG